MNEQNNKPIPEMKGVEFNNNIPVQNVSSQPVQDINPGNVVSPGQQVVNNNKVKKKKKNSGQGFIIALLIIMTLVLIGGMGYIYYEDNYLNKDDSIVTDVDEVHSPYRMSGNGLEDFDIHFMQLENKKSNMVYSPISIKYALAMLNEGTAGMSNAQIRGLIGDYNARKYTNSNNMSFANALFIRNSFKSGIKDSYVSNLTSKYGAEIMYDPITSPDPLNKWVSNKTFELIPDMFDNSITNSDFVLINALAIDMEWNKKIQADKLMTDNYSVSYAHEKYGHSITPVSKDTQKEVDFNNGKLKAQALEIGASINKYDIVEELEEENIRKTITKEYDEYIAKKPCGEGQYEDTETFVSKFIKELDSNYGRLNSSTDFEFYVDENTKVFAKDLKTYGGTTLQYVGIMPTNVSLTTYVEKTTAEEYNRIIKSLKKVEIGNFKEGVVTKITGLIPTFSFDYQLDLEKDLKKLNVTDIFDADKADLTGILPEKGNFISDTLHKATIDFSNDGIKAAAVTIFGGAGSAGCGFEHLYDVPVEVIDLTFDKPYVFFIHDKKTNEIWFTGTVYEPNKSEKKTSMN